MTPEEIQAAIKEAVEETTLSLKTKNSELLGKLKKAQAKAEIDPEEHQQALTKNEELEGKLSESEKRYKIQGDEFAKVKKAFDSEAGFTSKLLVDNGLNDALTKAGVKPEFLRAAKAMLKEQVTLKIDGENRSAVVGDKDLNAFATEWAASDEGKHYVMAPSNSGGGAHGGIKAPVVGKVITSSDFNAMTGVQRAAVMAAGTTISD